ncbi:MAG: signal peptidase I [Candidatus Moranbacteria bacterium]|nr:signal peptidase I [Candidatus Moranbacteria bacterium]
MYMQEESFFRGNKSSQEPAYGVGGFLLEIIKVFFLAFIIIVPIRMFIFQPFFVQGSSMEPNFHDGEYLLVNEWGYKHTDIGFFSKPFFSVEPFRELKRGDVVVFRYPKNPSIFYVKRIIALPGEKILFKEGRIEIIEKGGLNRFFLDESSYLPETTNTKNLESLALSDEEYFVMGDNRMHSNDSRAWGPVNKSFIIGKVALRMWPFDKISKVNSFE